MQLRQTRDTMAARNAVFCPRVLSALAVHQTMPSNPALRKSRRDDLFIVRKRPRFFSFCFSAARANASQFLGRSRPAPLKNKKNNRVAQWHWMRRSRSYLVTRLRTIPANCHLLSNSAGEM
jgi:hypothetical protein